MWSGWLSSAVEFCVLSVPRSELIRVFTHLIGFPRAQVRSYWFKKIFLLYRKKAPSRAVVYTREGTLKNSQQQGDGERNSYYTHDRFLEFLFCRFGGSNTWEDRISFPNYRKKRRPSSRMKKKNTLNEKRPIQRHQTSSRPFQDISAYPISERGNLKVKKMTGRYSGHNIVTSEDFSSGLSATSDPTRFFFQLKDDDTSCLDTVLSSRVTRQG